jgi:hypothetical protein
VVWFFPTTSFLNTYIQDKRKEKKKKKKKKGGGYAKRFPPSFRRDERFKTRHVPTTDAETPEKKKINETASFLSSRR